MKKLLLTFFTFSFCLSPAFAQSWLWAKEGHNGKSKLDYLNGETSVAMDKHHNVYETGKYDGDTIIFNSDTLFGTPFSVFLVKYNENGDLLWSKSSENSQNGLCEGNSVITDSRDNAYITGEFQDTVYFPPFSLKSPSNYYHNAFIVKYNANGNVKWAKQSNTSRKTNATFGFSIAMDKSEKYIYMTGGYEDTAYFGFDTLRGTAYPNAFLVKYDSNGNVIWTKQGINGVSGYSVGQCVITDNMGCIYVTGYYEHSITFGSITLSNSSLYLFSLFIVKYDSNGNVIWAKQPTPASSACGSYGDALGKDNSGNIYVTGYFFDTVSFGSYILTNQLFKYNSSSSLFWAKYDSNGNLLYAKQAYNHDSLQWEGWSITTDDKYNLYFSGSQGNSGTKKAKIIFGTDTLQNRVKNGSVWLKFDSNGAVLNSYIFPTGGDGPQDPIVVDSSGCYVYFGGTALDTTIIFGPDIVGPNFYTNIPFVTRWSDGGCPTGINTIESPNLTVNLYPNPNNGIFTIQSSLRGTKQSLRIYNILGEEVYTSNISQENTLIDLNNKASGIYLYRVTNQQGNFISSGKFIIQ